MNIIEIKCPYCYEWNRLTQHQYDLHDTFDCKDCYNRFRINDTVIEYL